MWQTEGHEDLLPQEKDRVTNGHRSDENRTVRLLLGRRCDSEGPVQPRRCRRDLFGDYRCRNDIKIKASEKFSFLTGHDASPGKVPARFDGGSRLRHLKKEPDAVVPKEERPAWGPAGAQAEAEGPLSPAPAPGSPGGRSRDVRAHIHGTRAGAWVRSCPPAARPQTHDSSRVTDPSEQTGSRTCLGPKCSFVKCKF